MNTQTDLNVYGNLVGYHTPTATKLVLDIINNTTNLDFVDGSWHNDLCDSLHLEIAYVPNVSHDFISIYIPNSTIDSEEDEKFNKYTILDDNQDTLLITESLQEVIDFLKIFKIIKKIKSEKISKNLKKY